MVLPPVVLAQFDIDGPQIPPLPQAPLFERVLLESPWPAVVLLLLAALVLFLVLNARAKLKPALLAGACVLLAAVGCYVVSVLVETPREKIKAGTRALVAATAEANRSELDRLLGDDLTMRVTRVPPTADKHMTMDLVEAILGKQYRVNDHSILEMQATIDGPRLGRTQVRVRVGSEYGSIPSWWRLDWELGADGQWRVRRIEALWIPGVVNPAGTG